MTELNERIIKVLVENGISTDGANGDDGLHNWRCAYPDSYGKGPCDHFDRLVAELAGAVSETPAIPESLCGVGGCVYLRGHRHNGTVEHSWSRHA